MEIKKESEGKWIYPSYGNFLVNASAKEDADKVIMLQVFVPLDESNDAFDEITASEKERIMNSKLVASGQITAINENLNSVSLLMTNSINSFGLSAEKALEFKDFFPVWDDIIGNFVGVGFRFRYKGKSEDYTLYEVIQQHTIQQDWIPGVSTASLYKAVNISNEGSESDPIPYTPPMEIYNGKYYTQNGVLYKCVRDSGIALTHDLSALVGNYVQTV